MLDSEYEEFILLFYGCRAIFNSLDIIRKDIFIAFKIKIYNKLDGIMIDIINELKDVDIISYSHYNHLLFKSVKFKYKLKYYELKIYLDFSNREQIKFKINDVETVSIPIDELSKNNVTKMLSNKFI